MSVDLSTEYLGLKLKNPVVIAACPLTEPLDSLRRLEDAGAAAAVFPSLFEEQIEHEETELTRVHEFGTETFAEALTYFPKAEEYRFETDAYLESIAAAKKTVSIPIIGSLNGVSDGGWIRYAKLIEEAGADALELNVYFIPADIDMPGEQVEARYLQLVASVKKSISIPLAVKIRPYFSSPANMAKRLVEAGADGLVLFNRFLQVEIDLEELAVRPRLVFSTPYELLLPLRWVAVLHGRLDASLAITSGIHGPDGMLQALLAGADVGMIASVLYKKGFGQIGEILRGMTEWMGEKEYESVAQLKGSMSLENCPDPSAFARGNYMKTLTSFTGQPI
jgi:dihydroorotate dehydrogenase (fumarate)